MHHPITPGKHWYVQHKEAAKKFEQEDGDITAAGGNPAEATIARLRSQLSRLDPKDDQYKEVARAISEEYARLYPGTEPDNAR
jgi:hypothetical protein